MKFKTFLFVILGVVIATNTEIMERDFPGYDYISDVIASTSSWGSIAAWGAFSLCVEGTVASCYRAYEYCRRQEENNQIARINCANAIEEAAMRATTAVFLIAGIAIGAGASAKRSDFETMAAQVLEDASSTYGFKFKLLSDYSDIDVIGTQDESGDKQYVLQDTSKNLTYYNVKRLSAGRYGSYMFNNLEHVNKRKRADTCMQGEKCTEARTQYFGPYFIAADVCMNHDFNFYSDGGNWKEVTMGHLQGDSYCADYYKLYPGGGKEWGASWRIYDGKDEYWWTKCDTGA